MIETRVNMHLVKVVWETTGYVFTVVGIVGTIRKFWPSALVVYYQKKEKFQSLVDDWCLSRNSVREKAIEVAYRGFHEGKSKYPSNPENAIDDAMAALRKWKP